MFRLVHLSDPHLGPLPAVTAGDLASKRILGYINWRRNRAGAMASNLQDALVAAVSAARPDHVAVTGDLVNLALEGEIEPARRFLARLGPPEEVSLVPGNHDAYVPGAVRRFESAWAPWMTGDGDRPPAWPYLRRRGPLALVGLSTACATAPFMATGSVGAPQGEALGTMLEGLDGEAVCRVLLIHHPPTPGGPWHKRLVDARRVRSLVARHGAGLVLHGHTHLPTRAAIDGAGGAAVPVVGVPAALQRPGGHRPASGFNVIEIGPTGKGWRIEVALRQFDPAQDRYVETARDGFDLPRR